MGQLNVLSMTESQYLMAVQVIQQFTVKEHRWNVRSSPAVLCTGTKCLIMGMNSKVESCNFMHWHKLLNYRDE
jgi:hypothetical protein